MNPVRVIIGGASLVLTLLNSSVHFNGFFLQVSTEEGSEQLDETQLYSFKKTPNIKHH